VGAPLPAVTSLPTFPDFSVERILEMRPWNFSIISALAQWWRLLTMRLISGRDSRFAEPQSFLLKLLVHLAGIDDSVR
jgi:hypothetical protein